METGMIKLLRFKLRHLHFSFAFIYPQLLFIFFEKLTVYFWSFIESKKEKKTQKSGILPWKFKATECSCVESSCELLVYCYVACSQEGFVVSSGFKIANLNPIFNCPSPSWL